MLLCFVCPVNTVDSVSGPMNFSRLEQSLGCLCSPSSWSRNSKCRGNAGAHWVICSNPSDCSVRRLLCPCTIPVQPNASKKLVRTIREDSQTHGRRNSLAPVSLNHFGHRAIKGTSFCHTTTCASSPQVRPHSLDTESFVLPELFQRWKTESDTQIFCSSHQKKTQGHT